MLLTVILAPALVWDCASPKFVFLLPCKIHIVFQLKKATITQIKGKKKDKLSITYEVKNRKEHWKHSHTATSGRIKPRRKIAIGNRFHLQNKNIEKNKKEDIDRKISYGQAKWKKI